VTLADVDIRTVAWKDARKALLAVRVPVYVEEQHVRLDEEVDGDDPESLHVLATDRAGVPIGTGRLTLDGRIGRMAVLRSWRGRGLGGAILRALLDEARRAGHAEATLSAQVRAEPFYERFGFVAEGRVFEDARIPHRWMRLRLAPAQAGSTSGNSGAG
jgi:predicted GNAT family N-acyltransferase